MNDGALTITLSFAGALMLIVGLGLDASAGSFAPATIAGMGGILLGVAIADTQERSR